MNVIQIEMFQFHLSCLPLLLFLLLNLHSCSSRQLMSHLYMFFPVGLPSLSCPAHCPPNNLLSFFHIHGIQVINCSIFFAFILEERKHRVAFGAHCLAALNIPITSSASMLWERADSVSFFSSAVKFIPK